ncbi:alginate export family protein [Sphingomonas sanxanigenens]|uniref:Alginate export domain-containing protein n=1 Tax=Sphingomonas sanxanigenens DSM 19645 = NX02 TaxID=1123269 RepID=W0AGW7_9SPHN|nr:alginate export family protein [Sphingomonas sanxanigenens]AHE55508.1 hypothetical protein NX02_19220 [Sphingomonas sanxanigenens DSM 19645 = NX02]
MRWSFASVAAAAATVIPVTAHAQPGTDVTRAPTLTVERYSEDWSHLADPDLRTGRWTEPFKYIELDKNASVYLTTGVEARSRFEGYANTDWGARPDDSYVWHRLMPYADLHAGKVRLFAQPILSAISDVDRPKAPVDTTGVDILQAFAEVELDIAARTSLRISAGRKLLSLGAGRLIDTRYGPNVPQAFDGSEARLTGPTYQITAIYVRPVDTSPGGFNDRTSRQKAVWGAYATNWFKGDRKSGIDLYYLGYRDAAAVFDQGADKQMIHSFGARLFGDTGKLHWNLETLLQRGTFGDGRVAAWGFASEIGYRFTQTSLRPEIALTTDVISGDHDPDDATLGTFNPMFPRGSYFASQAPIGPRNIIHIQPSATIHPHEAVTLSLKGVAYWRESRHDGIYAIPGFLVRSGRHSDARFVGKQIEFAMAWQATPELNLSASMSSFAPGRFIRETGPARTMRVAGGMANFRF